VFTLAEDDELRPGWRPNEPPNEAAPGFTSKDGRVWFRDGIWHALPFRKYARVLSAFLSADDAMHHIEHDAMERANAAPPPMAAP